MSSQLGVFLTDDFSPKSSESAAAFLFNELLDYD
jgi:hypothetical protein